MYHKYVTGLQCEPVCRYFMTIVWNSGEIWGLYNSDNEDSKSLVYEGMLIGTEYVDNPEELAACIFRVKVFKEDLE